MDEAFPYIAKRLMTDDSPRLQAALRYMVRGAPAARRARRLPTAGWGWRPLVGWMAGQRARRARQARDLLESRQPCAAPAAPTIPLPRWLARPPCPRCTAATPCLMPTA